MTEPTSASLKSSDTEHSGDPWLGAIIKRARLAAGLSQEDVAKLVGVSSKAAVSQWEKGRNKITDENRRQLSVALKIPLHIMFRTEEPHPSIKDDLELTDIERDLVMRFRRLLPGRQEAVLLVLSSYDDPGEPRG